MRCLVADDQQAMLILPWTTSRPCRDSIRLTVLCYCSMMRSVIKIQVCSMMRYCSMMLDDAQCFMILLDDDRAGQPAFQPGLASQPAFQQSGTL